MSSSILRDSYIKTQVSGPYHTLRPRSNVLCQNSVLTLVGFSFPVASCLFSGSKDKNEVVDYDSTNACHEHNVRMRVVAGIYVINL